MEPDQMPVPLHLIDAFTDGPFSGNPAGVCLLDQPQPDPWLQAVAREMNQAETAFLHRVEEGFELRWFTPAVEVDLCGHATLASAHFLWQERLLAPETPARFLTRSGVLSATRRGEWITLDFPATPAQPSEPPSGLFAGLGVRSASVLRSRFDYLVVLEQADQLRELRPDLGRLREIDTRGIIVTTPSDLAGVDFLSRFFAPAAGVDEDPVTGSAHCALAPYWAARLGRRSLIGKQISRRGGTVGVEDAGERVYLSGRAVTVVKGTLLSEVGNSPETSRPG